MSSALFGVLIGAAWFVMTTGLPQPAGSIVFWGAIAVHLAWCASVCWQRTGLPFVTSAMVSGAASSLSLAVLAGIGQPFPDLAPASWLLFGIAAGIGPVLLLIESHVNAPKWHEWRRVMADASAWDIIRARHIPRLRGLRPGGPLPLKGRS